MTDEKRVTVKEAAEKSGLSISTIHGWKKKEEISWRLDRGGSKGIVMVLLSEIKATAKRHSENKRRKPVNFRISNGTRKRLHDVAAIEGLENMREAIELMVSKAWDTFYARHGKENSKCRFLSYATLKAHSWHARVYDTEAEIVCFDLPLVELKAEVPNTKSAALDIASGVAAKLEVENEHL